MRFWRLWTLLFVLMFSVGMALSFQGEAEQRPELNPTVVACLVASPVEGFVDFGMEATAYTAGFESTGKRPGDPAYGITKSGTTVEEGRTIATDPRVIPLGTHVEVWYEGEKMGDYVAEDTGGLIKGCIIDIYYENLDDALNWGRRQVIVRVPREAVSQ